MRFKSFKSFTLGKPKGAPEIHGRASSQAEQITIMKKINGHTRDHEEMTDKIQELAGVSAEEEGAGPHAPLGELSVEPGDEGEAEVAEIFVPESEDKGQEDVKVVEMGMNEKPAAESKPAAGPGDAGNPLSGLFTDEEEEENPLANLIKSLPDYTTHEIVEDLNEIKRIIHEWRRE
jgi:hypothetical protein